MVTRTNGHLFHLTNAFIKAAGADRFDGINWNELVSELDKLTEITNADSPFTPNEDDTFIIADAAAGAVTIGPTAASGLIGKEYIIIKKDSSGNAVTFDPSGGELVDNATSKSVTTQGGLMRVKATSTEWFSTSVAPGAGEANTGANVGAGTGIFRDKTGVNLNFKSMIAGANVAVVDNGNDITVSSTAGATTNIFEGGVQVGSGGLAPNFDATDFNVAENAGKADISLNYGTGAGQPAEGSHTHPLTGITNLGGASGDIIIWNGTNWIRLAKGSDGQVLKLASGLPGWGTDDTGGGSAVTGYTVPSAATVSAINTALGTTQYKKVGLVSTDIITTNMSIRLKSTGQMLWGQQARLQATAAFSSGSGASFTGDGMIFLGDESTATPPSGTASTIDRNYLRISDLIVDFNSEPNHGRGISNYGDFYDTGGGATRHYIGTGGTQANDNTFKQAIIQRVVFEGHTQEGKECIYLRNMENGGVVAQCRVVGLDSTQATPTAAFRFSDVVGVIGGNIICRDNYISLGGNSARGIQCDGNIERILSQGNRIFSTFDDDPDHNNRQVGFWWEPDSTGKMDNRAWHADNCSIEDVQYGFVINIPNSAAGIWGFSISNNLLDMKNCATNSSGLPESIAIDFRGAGESAGHIHHNNIGARFQANTEVCTGIDVTDIVTTSGRGGVQVDHNTFAKKPTAGAGSTASFTPITGLLGKKDVLIHDNPGYNPVSVDRSSTSRDIQTTWTAMTNPWATSGNSDKGIYNVSASPGQAAPVNGTPYIVYQTKKRFIIQGGSGVSIVIDGITIPGSTFVGVLDPYETIRVNFTTAPTAQVLCL